MREAGTGVHWAVVDRAAGRVCGGIGLNRTDWAALVTEVSYWVGPWARGRGHAPEALRAVADWVLRDQGFERLELRAATGNLASQRVAEKAGFTPEGVLRNAAPSTQDGWTWSSSRSCGAIRRPGSRASGPSPPAGGDHVAASLCGLAFMDAATPAAGPRVLAGDRDLGFVLMEDLGSGPSLERLTATEHTWDEQGVVVQASRPDAQVTATLRAIGIRLDNPVLRVTRVAVV